MEESQVVIVRLSTGEELIGTTIDSKTDEDCLFIKMALAVGVNHQEQRLVFVPFMPYTDAADGLYIRQRHVIAVVIPNESLTNDYLEATGQKPKIFMPGKKPILTPVN